MKLETVSLDEIRRLNEAAGQYFFESATIRFFRSSIPAEAFKSRDGRFAYFVTGEQFVGSDGVKAPRRFTIRVATLVPLGGHRPGRIDTVGEFQHWNRRKGATAEAQRLAATIVPVIP